jgi:CHAT domain-containing protein
VPCGRVGLLPLHAITWAEPDGETSLLDQFVVSYAPSAAVYQAARDRARRLKRRSPVLVGIANPLPSPNPLPAAEAELAAVAGTWFGEELTRVGIGATKRFVLEHLGRATHLHFACHGESNVGGPFEPTLHLGGGDRLTLSDVLKLQLEARLVVLSACESGHFALQIPDEVVGLPAGFLQAGAAAVLATLWQVDDVATALLITKFYELIGRSLGERVAGPLAPAEALRVAQQWLRRLSRREEAAYVDARPQLRPLLRRRRRLRDWTRQQLDDTPYRLPRYWAAFYLTGT